MSTTPAIRRVRRSRGGTIAMELLLNLPIWLIVLVGVLDFGEMLSDAQQVSMACREGAEEASRIASLATAGEVPAKVVDAVARHLAAAGMAPSKIILDHNASRSPTRLSWGNRRGGPPQPPLPTCGEFVRVTVVAQARGLLPKALRCLGIEIAPQCLTQSVAFRQNASPTETE